MVRGKSNELSLVLLCLNKAISIYIYKITSHKYIWQYDVLNFLAKGDLAIGHVQEYPNVSLSGLVTISLEKKDRKKVSCTIKSNQNTQKHP